MSDGIAGAALAELTGTISAPGAVASVFNGLQHQLRAARHAREQAAALKAKTGEVTAIVKSLAGKTFFDADSNRRFEISTTAQEIVIYDCRENQPRVARENWSFDFLAAMIAGR